MRRFRKIVVDDAEYKWLFRYDDYDGSNCPYLLIVRESIPEETWRIYFPVTDHFLLNSGFPAVFQGKKTAINLNRPFYVSQMIRYCGDHEEEISQAGYEGGHKDLDGIKILLGIGYDIPAAFRLRNY